MSIRAFAVRTLALAAFVSVGVASQARADFTTFPGGSCGGNSFSTCAAVSLTSSVDGFGNTVITVTVQNLGTNGELYKSIGLIAVPAGSSITLTSAPTGYGPPPPNDLNGAGLPDDQYGATANSQGDMLANDGSTVFTFVFTFDGTLTAEQIAALGVGIHGISGPNNCSTKMGVTSGGVVDNADPALAAGCGTTTAPEPISMALMATGLAGMSGAGLLRRRKQQNVA